MRYLSPEHGAPDATGRARLLTSLVLLTLAVSGIIWAVGALGEASGTGRDRIGPVTTSDALASYESVAEITLTATDENGSGVATTTWRVDRSAWSSGTYIEISTPGTHVLEYTSTDRDGNEEPVNRAVFVIGRAASPGAVADADRGQDSSPPGASGIKGLLASSAAWIARLFVPGDDGTAVASESVPLSSAKSAAVSAPELPGAVSSTKRYTARGTVEPGDSEAVGEVRIHLWRRSASGKWEDRGSVTAIVEGAKDAGATYSASIELPERGIWRLEAEYSADGGAKPSRSAPVEVQSVGSKLIALTFDDGPDPRGTPEVLAALRDQDARATFFLLGWRANKYPDVVRSIAEGGHQLGNHRYTHKVSSPLLSADEFRSEVTRTNKAIKRALGAGGEGQVAHRYRIDFRYPWGHGSAQTDAVLDSLGVREQGWDYGPGDGGNHGPPSPRVTDLIARKVIENARPGSVILLHDSPDRPNTVAAVPIILAELGSQGYDFVTVEDLRELGR